MSIFKKILFSDRIDCFKPFLKNKKVLDLGCVGGDYRLSKRVITSLHEQIFNEAKITIGIDLDKKGLDLMKKNNKNFNLVYGDVYKLPFKNFTFDVVVAGDIIEHLDNLGILLKEVKRVLRNDGVFIGTVPNAYNLAGIIRLLLRSQPTPTRHSTHVHIFDNRSLYLLFLQNGFNTKILFRNFPHILKIITKIYPMFSPAILFVARKISEDENEKLLNKFYKSIKV